MTLGVGLFHLLSKAIVDAVVTILFLGGAVFARRESSTEAEATIDCQARGSTHARTIPDSQSSNSREQIEVPEASAGWRAIPGRLDP